jgi:ABC-2 type transport system permease protein
MAKSTEELREALDAGAIKLGLTIPRGFMKNIGSNRKVSLLAQIDGVDGNGANIASSYLMDITGNFINKTPYFKEMMIKNHAMSPMNIVEINPEFLFNPNGEPTMHYIPGIMALLITIVSITLTAFSLVKEKEMGTFEQLMVTPINKIQFIAGKITPFFLLSLLEMVIAVIIIQLVYGIEIRSNPGLLLLGIILYLLNSLSIGIFVSTITKTQQQALFLAWFMMIFIIMMSGFLFPVENMPDFLEKLSKFNPLYYFINILRGVFVKGSGFNDLLPEYEALFLLGAAATFAGYFSFSKKNI